MSIINWKALQVDAEDISDLVTTLSRFYRTALNKGNNLISVRDEIDNVQSYIKIQLIMHDGSFDVEYDLEEAIYAYDMINLALQPIVENAIEHGIDCKMEGRGLLRLVGRTVGENVAFTVEDNGPGLDPELQRTSLTQQTSGYGLKNVQERIRLLFGEAYGVSVASEPGRGTRMTITFPQYRRS
ncbi:sensor histidine kinase [Cohnella sp. REN36]|uniref:sensor histidine kinase n=1 Tax=Cohnella sp. REN36 TaxID=2887347 RepID=UPI001D15BEDF|nr:ATP-binding protein [Cohnella sp. REN36]MCC3374609.1 histidine kinase [Cohnella sp. REN36]